MKTLAGFLFLKFVNGGRFDLFAVDMSSSVFPGVCRIISLNMSMFSSGIGSNVVLFMVCTAFIYQISPAGILFVIIFIVSPSVPLVPMSPGVSISLFPVGEFFATLICISFCFIVFGGLAL